MISNPETAGVPPAFACTGTAGVPPAFACARFPAFTETVLVGRAVFGMKPSCTHFRHHDSKSAPGDGPTTAEVEALVAFVAGEALGLGVVPEAEAERGICSLPRPLAVPLSAFCLLPTAS